jgi:integrase
MPFRRGKKWFSDIRPRVSGRPTAARVRKLLPGVTTRRDAVEAENSLARKLSGGEPDPAPLLSDYLRDTYLPWARANKACPEIDERFVKWFCASECFAGRRLDEVSPIQVEAFKRDLRSARSSLGAPYNPGSINNALAVLSRAFRLAADGGLIRSNPCRMVAYLDPLPRTFRTLEREDEPKLFAALGDVPHFLKPATQLALLTGMRECEVVSLTTADVDSGRMLVFVRKTKWRKDPRRSDGLPVSASALSLLLELCAKAQGGRLFRTETGKPVRPAYLSQIFISRATAAGFAGLHFRHLRHTFGTRLGDMGASSYEIARLMGHGDIKTSMIYVHHERGSLRRVLEGAEIGHSMDTARRQEVA